MRLLNTQTALLEEKDEHDETLQYAILSHTWLRRSEGEGEEVLFADMTDLATARRKTGWTKLQFAMEQAASDGLQYVWVDTCCINKESSAELAESINSMFRFYQNSKICYVYLDRHMKEDRDVSQAVLALNDNDTDSAPTMRSVLTSTTDLRAGSASSFGARLDERKGRSAHLPISETGSESFHNPGDGSELRLLRSVSDVNVSNVMPRPNCRVTAFFQACRWFTRGWTLQEMIASKNVAFYDASGIYIGALADLVDIVSSITDVHRDILTHRRPLSSFSIAQRMAWAANRETTRVEDRAYSMLGIFDISLPVIYGEGERAFRRLQEELLRVYNDHTIFAWGYQTSDARYPRKRPPSGKRENLLASSPDAFKDRTYTRLTAITGGDDQKQYEVLGRTIRFHLPIFDMPKKEDFKADLNYTAVLNCRFEDDPSHYVVLHFVCEVSGDLTRSSVSSCDAYEAATRTANHAINVLREANDPYQRSVIEAWQSADGSEDLWVRCFRKSLVYPDLLVIQGHGCMATHAGPIAVSHPSAVVDDGAWNNDGWMFRLPSTLSGSMDAFPRPPSDRWIYYDGHLSILSGTHSEDIKVNIKIYPEISEGHFLFNKESQIAIDLSENAGRQCATPSDYNILRLKRGKNLLAEVKTTVFLSQRFRYIEFRVLGRRWVAWVYVRKYYLTIRSWLSFVVAYVLGLLIIASVAVWALMH